MECSASRRDHPTAAQRTSGFAGLREGLDILEKKSESQIVQPVA